MRDHLLVVHLGSPMLVEEKRDGEPRARRWIESGQINLTPGGQSVYRLVRSSADVLVSHLSTLLVTEVAESLYGVDPARVSLRPRFGVQDKVVDGIAKLLLAEAEAGETGTQFVAEMLSRALAARLLRYHSSLEDATPDPPGPIASKRLRQVIEFMHDHADDKLTLARLAELSDLSPSHFARAFRDATGSPPHTYLMAVRMRKACNLLEHSSSSVIDIALQCGFQWPTHFAAAFRKHTGLTPRAWRNARRF